MPPKSKTDWPKCSACERSVKTSFNANLHPLLKVLVCRSCYINYGTGDFSTFADGVDENGDDNYCRLCVDGGDLFFCGNTDDSVARCHYGFCKECIKRLCPSDAALTVDPNDEDWNWSCLACDRTKLKEARQATQATIVRLSERDLKRTDEATTSATKKRKVDTAEKEPETRIASTSTTERTKTSRSSDVQPPPDRVKTVQADTSKQSSAPSLDKSKSSRGETSRPTDVSLVDKPKSSKGEASKQNDSHLVANPKATLVHTNRQNDVISVKVPRLDTSELNDTPFVRVVPRTDVNKQSDLSSSDSTSASLGRPKGFKVDSGSGKQVESPVTEKPKTTKGDVSQSHNDPPSADKLNVLKADVGRQDHGASIEKHKTSKLEISQQREPEARSMPHLEKPRQPKTSLRNLSGPRNPKQLKVNNEPVTPKIILNEVELKKRLRQFGIVKELCLKEINTKFSTILEMFDSAESENKSLLKCEIEDIKRPMQEFMNMVANLEGLRQAQT